MQTHPFEPQIPGTATKLLIGTLPPEGVKFYFSNSSNTRLWDILMAIENGETHVGVGGNDLSDSYKIKILKGLKLGISDIIHSYERDAYNSTKDSHINPKKYNDIVQLALDRNINELLFVYQSALKWFMHSLEKNEPQRLSKINAKYEVGEQVEIKVQGKTVKLTLLPSPLNRGRKGETLEYKLKTYRKYIVGQ